MSATATTTAPDPTAPDTTLTAAEATPDTSSNPIDAVIARLDPASARIKWWTAFAVMTLPALGFVASLYLLVTGHLQAQDAVLFAVFYFLHMGGITMGFHRYLSHKAFKTSRPVEAVLMACGSMAAQGPIMYWVTTHRRHHLYSDRPGDPHSPNLNGQSFSDRVGGLWYAHMPWMMSPETSKWGVFAPDVLRDRRLFFFQRTYPLWVLTGLLAPALIGYLVGHTLMAAVSRFPRRRPGPHVPGQPGGLVRGFGVPRRRRPALRRTTTAAPTTGRSPSSRSARACRTTTTRSPRRTATASAGASPT